jgi:ActR/RegA family two-component response regulator
MNAMEEKEKDRPEPEAVVKTISLNEALALINEKHKINVGEDDPVMALVTLNAAFCNDQHALLQRHEKAITVVMSKTVNDLRDKIQTETQSFAVAVDKLTTGKTLAMLEAFSKELADQRQFVFLSAVALVTVPAIMFGILLGIIFWRS